MRRERPEEPERRGAGGAVEQMGPRGHAGGGDRRASRSGTDGGGGAVFVHDGMDGNGAWHSAEECVVKTERERRERQE